MTSVVDRRRFLLTSLAGALAVPIGAGAQQAGKVWRIGVLSELAVNPSTEERWRRVLRRQNYIEGQNIVFERRYASERFEVLPALAAELVHLKVDIILTMSTPAAAAVKQATPTIPIITISSDPVGAGLVASLARPESNVTGVFVPLADLGAKRLQLLREAVPTLNAVAVLGNLTYATVRSQMTRAEEAARGLGIATHSIDVPTAAAVDQVFTTIVARRVGGVLVLQDPVMSRALRRLAELAAKHRLPMSHTNREFADAGGLMSYGFSLEGAFETAATQVHKILSGARPADVPMEQPRHFELVINLKTAKALGLTIPPSLLARADRVIE